MNNPFQDLADKLTSIERMLVDLTQSVVPVAPSAGAQLLSVAEAAKFLRLSTQTVYDKIHAGTLPYVKQGNRIYFFQDELIQWLKSGRPKTNDELQAQTSDLLQTTLSTRQRRKGRKNL